MKSTVCTILTAMTLLGSKIRKENSTRYIVSIYLNPNLLVEFVPENILSRVQDYETAVDTTQHINNFRPANAKTSTRPVKTSLRSKEDPTFRFHEDSRRLECRRGNVR